MTDFPTPRLRRTLILYKLAWIVLFPAILVYLALRGRKDPAYVRHMGERFGRYAPLPGAVWVHAVSLGEVRSAVPLIRAYLARGERVVVTHFTPAGRSETERVFGAEIAAAKVRAVWVPFEFRWCYRRFFRAFRPKFGLVMEIEVWPEMVLSARAGGVPLFLCNAQYPAKSLAKDQGRARADLMRGFSGALVKSELQKARFSGVGVRRIAVTGELRFDQPIPPGLVAKGRALRESLGDRPVVTIASAVEGEDALYIETIRAVQAAHAAKGLDPPLFIYVPRAPDRFDEVAGLVSAAGLKMLRRSQVFSAELTSLADIGGAEVLLGDSLGEMYFYLALCDVAVVGGGYVPKGAHNISEPLALGKPVIVGPQTWTIEYPVVEAEAAGVARVVEPEALAAALAPGAPRPDPRAIADFFAAHSGGVEKTLAAVDRFLAEDSAQPKS